MIWNLIHDQTCRAAGDWAAVWGREFRRTAVYLDHAFPAGPPSPKWATEARTLPINGTVQLRIAASEVDAGIPALIVTPQVNHSYIADFEPDQSLVRTLLSAGFGRVAVTDWLPPLDRRPYGIADSIDDIRFCIEALGGRVHLVGLCQGGWQSAIVAALHADAVVSLTVAAAPIDTSVGTTGLDLFVRGLPMAAYEWIVFAGGGRAPGSALSCGFDLLRPDERFVGNYRDLYLNALDPEYVERYDRIRNWYRLNKDVAGELYLEVVRDLFKGNRLARGTMRIRDRTVDLGAIRCPVFLVGGTEDHITPVAQVMALRALAPRAPCRTWTVKAGHVGVFMGRTALRTVWPEIAAGMLGSKLGSAAARRRFQSAGKPAHSKGARNSIDMPAAIE